MQYGHNVPFVIICQQSVFSNQPFPHTLIAGICHEYLDGLIHQIVDSGFLIFTLDSAQPERILISILDKVSEVNKFIPLIRRQIWMSLQFTAIELDSLAVWF